MSKPLCVIQGPVFSRSGYGDLATDLARSIIRYDKYDVKIAPTRWGGCPSKVSDNDLNTEEDKKLFSHFLNIFDNSDAVYRGLLTNFKPVSLANWVKKTNNSFLSQTKSV